MRWNQLFLQALGSTVKMLPTFVLWHFGSNRSWNGLPFVVWHFEVNNACYGWMHLIYFHALERVVCRKMRCFFCIYLTPGWVNCLCKSWIRHEIAIALLYFNTLHLLVEANRACEDWIRFLYFRTLDPIVEVNRACEGWVRLLYFNSLELLLVEKRDPFCL